MTDLVNRMETWPRSWAGCEADVNVGQGLVEQMRPFILHLRDAGLTRKTIRRHLDNAWRIGGEIIRRLTDDLRRQPPRTLLLDAIDLGEAPLLYPLDEAEQRACDATARKLLKYMSR